MTGLWIASALLVAVAGVVAVVSYNRLVGLREGVRAAWAQVDVLLKRRHDLIPNLVETVKGYAAHESQSLQAVVAARAAAVAAGSPAQQIGAEAALSTAVRGLVAVAEAYPDLKANQNFLHLQQELAATENQIAAGRQAYNAEAARYNAATLTFPAALLAGAFGFTPQPFFEVHDAAERDVPAVKF